jgi:undecaprenyl-diphosphatase
VRLKQHAEKESTASMIQSYSSPDPRPPLAVLAGGLAATVVSTALLGKVADHFLTPGSLKAQLRELIFARRPRRPLIDPLMNLCSAAGEPFVLYPVSLLALARWAATGRAGAGVLLGVALLGSAGATKGTKLLVQRPRPPLPLHKKDSSGSSFPSQHVVMSLATYGMIAYLRGQHGLRPPARPTLLRRWAFVALLCLAISVSRVYQGVHRPTDVVGGWLAGLLWLGTCVLAARTLGGPTPAPTR